ncbi:MAG: monovalent cation/H+ antiporter complex subunit F [Methanocorpusculum sp.]|nr:monovalent cation/H+ antiporter complex subunit F [Methanocorpusculum sp.]
MNEIFIYASIIFIILIIACIIRLILGPTNADRMLALDVINILVVIAMILLSVGFRQVIILDVAIVYALLSFVGTLYVAKLITGDLK